MYLELSIQMLLATIATIFRLANPPEFSGISRIQTVPPEFFLIGRNPENVPDDCEFPVTWYLKVIFAYSYGCQTSGFCRQNVTQLLTGFTQF